MSGIKDGGKSGGTAELELSSNCPASFLAPQALPAKPVTGCTPLDELASIYDSRPARMYEPWSPKMPVSPLPIGPLSWTACSSAALSTLAFKFHQHTGPPVLRMPAHVCTSIEVTIPNEGPPVQRPPARPSYTRPPVFCTQHVKRTRAGREVAPTFHSIISAWQSGFP
ncbi:hypothetical protein GGX14DRAFT_607220 [Mycena pura]|uniref:Uncharacterized protein n=1 Tax=Mycena pura TaxID=153505 RepID=A0AAD6VPP1_9AGAR|nr:hypothetical protein GGX14DRAFT_607220 [Mycena pura]